IVVVLFALLALARAQFGFGDFGGHFGGGFADAAPVVNQRDARANTGPVVFPAAPQANGETSGVVVGASGYGFVPPSGPSKI
ncbi:PREDICTED: uncharacterized protein LOC108565309, partial [Nicrophorus vespilloides]|uniref:Uncharacterized protein LOC108565309 n=1 Tax=Nicrophorus vespilloides TaxID=110193 RepID=A0ABM1N038_NICVS